MSTNPPSRPNQPPFFQDHDKFDGTNFFSWGPLIYTAAGIQGVTGYLKGTIENPVTKRELAAKKRKEGNATGEDSTEISPPQPSSATEWFSDTPSDQEWQTRNAWAMGLLIYNIKDPIALGVTMGGTAAEAWSSICTQYNVQSSIGRVASEQELRTFRMEENGDFTLHMQQLQTLKASAVNAGSRYSDDDWKMIVLCSLPKSWRSVITTLYDTGTAADAIAKLRLHYMQMKRAEETPTTTQSSVTALQARSNSNRPFRTRTQLQCTNPNCNRRGHSIENCYWRGGGKEGQFPPGFGQRAGNTNPQAPTTTPQARLADASTATQPTLTPTFLCMAMIPAIEDVSSDTDEASVVAMAIATEVSQHQVVGTYLDSGATDHCFVNIGEFEAYTKFDQDKAGMGATKGGSFAITGKGRVGKTVNGQNGKTKLIFNDALHTPTLTANLISVPKLDSSNFTITFKGGIAQMTNPSGRHILNARKDGSGLYAVVFEGEEEPGTHALAAKSLKSPASLALWHRRFAHAGISTIKEMASKSLVDGMIINGDDSSGKCEDCVYGKHTVRPFDGTTEPEEEVLKRLYIDLWGPAPIRSLGGAIYLMLISDGGSSVKFPYALPNKSGETTLVAFTQFQAMAERTTGKKIIFVHIDEGSEWWNGDWDRYFNSNGITREASVPYAHAQNGLAERSIRTVMDAVRTILVDSGLPHFLWAEAVNFVCYVLGFVPSSRHPGVIPWEKWTSRRQDVSHVRPFGSTAYARVPTELIKSKLDPRSVKLVLIGYYGYGSYRLYNPSTRAIYKSRDVIFEEGKGHRTLPLPPSLPDPDQDTSAPPITKNDDQVIVKSTPLTGIAPRVTDASSIQRERQEEADLTPPGATAATQIPTGGEHATTTPTPVPAPARRSSRIAELPAVNYSEKNFTSTGRVLLADADGDRVPKSYKEAMRSPDIWGPPTRDELLNLLTHEVFELVPRSSVPAEKSVITSGFVYANKYDADGHIVKRKGRVVAKGYLQVPGEDFEETYASVARLESFRMVIALATVLEWELWQLDFVAAYLNADIDCDVYMEVPPGYLDMLREEGIEVGVDEPVAKLKKGLYGTMQAGNGWWHELDKSYEGLGYYRSVADSCVRSRSMNGVHTIVSTHTDDVMGASSTDGGAEEAMAELDRCYEAKKTRDPTLILGIEIRKDKETTTISQSSFIIRVLERFNLTSCTIKSTPLPTGITLSTSHSPATAEEATWMRTRPYRALLGAIMWIQVGTRPDIAFATNTLARFQSNPGKAHWNALLHLAGYLRGTLDRGITYYKGSGSDLKPFGYVDADYGGDTDTRRSTSGYVFMMGGGPVSWNSKLQPTVALSTSEAEYMGLTRAAQQVLWMHAFMSEVGLPQEFPLTLNCDNSSSIALASSTKGHSRAKHIDIRYHYIREKVQKEIKLQHVPSASNLADVLTKPLPRDVHLTHLNSLLSKGLNGHSSDA